MYSPRQSPLPHDHGGTGDRGEATGSSSRSSSASGSATSGTRSPSRSARMRSSRPDVSSSMTSLPMETVQSLNAAYNAGPMYIGEGIGSPVQGRASPVSSGASGKSNSLSPRNSPTPSRSSSLGSSQGFQGSPLTGSDGAESQGEHLASNNSNSTHHHPEDMRPPREAMLLDVHTQLREYQLENASLKQELEAKETKLASSMNSIKTFWSPELKKERAARKEEATRMQVLKDQFRTSMEENQNYCQDVKQLHEELQQQREFNAQLQASLSTHAVSGAHPHHEVDALRSERDRLSKEVFLLRKTLEEMEIRIETQKQTLAARDESIKKLLEMLQSKGLSTKHLEVEREEADRLRSKVVEAESRILQLETMLDQRNRERGRLADERQKYAAQAGWFEQQLADSVLQSEESVQKNLVKSLCETARTKDDKIASLENQVLEYKDELRRIRSHGSLTPEERDEQQREIEDYKSHSKLLKNQVDQLKLELNKKSSEVQALQTKIESLTHQQQDYQAHVSLLKESLAAKEQHSSILQADVEALRARIDEKEMTIVRKEQLLSTLSTDKTKRYSEVSELREMVEIKDRKIIVLQRKIDNLQEQLQEKEEQYRQTRSKLTSVQADQTSSDSAMSSLEDALMDKDKAMDRLKEQRERYNKEHEEQVEGYKKQLKDLRTRLETVQKELAEKEASLLDLKEHATTLASSSLKKDSRITTVELAVAQKTEEIARLESDVKKKARKIHMLREDREEMERQSAKTQEDTTTRHREEIDKTQNEVDRLLEIMKEMEGEKNDKDKRVTELETVIRRHCPGQLKDATKRLTGVKRDQQLQKRKNAQLLEEARRREGELSTDTSQLQSFVKQRDDRIEELEEALKESVSITADREMVLAQQTQTITNLQRQIDSLKRELEQVKKQLSTASNKLSTTTTVLRDKEAKLSALQMERRKTLEEAMEMKQEAITAAIGEKDAHIALLELNRKNPKACEELKGLKKEKDALVQQLKDEYFRRKYVSGESIPTQSRIKFIHNCNDSEKSTHSTLEQSPNTPDQDEEDTIWA